MTSDIRNRLGILAEEATAGVMFHPIEVALRGHRRRRLLALSTAAVVGAGGLATGLILAVQSPRPLRVTTQSPSAAQNLVPWINQPPPALTSPAPTPTAPPSANAPACDASQVTMSAAGRNGAGGHTAYYLSFTNISHKTCLLAGYPRVVATQQGKPPVTARQGSFFSSPQAAANIAPGATAELTLETDRDCPATLNPPAPAPDVYSTVTVYLTGGNKVLTEAPLNLTCGLYETQFGVPQPSPTYPTSPLVDLAVSMQLPRAARAGHELDYVIDLTNPTDTTIDLAPCPGYIEHSIELEAKEEYALNCNTQAAVYPHQTIRYAMVIHVAATALPGLAHISWSFILPGAAAAKGTLEIQR